MNLGRREKEEEGRPGAGRGFEKKKLRKKGGLNISKKRVAKTN